MMRDSDAEPARRSYPRQPQANRVRHAARWLRAPKQRHAHRYSLTHQHCPRLLLAFILWWCFAPNLLRADTATQIEQPRIDPSTVIKIPLTVIDNSAYALPVRVNNEHEIMLLLDTGASETIFNTSALRQLGLKVQKTRKRRQGIFKSGRVGFAQFDDLNVGGISIGEYTATTANYPIDYEYWQRRNLPVTEGLLGFDVLKKLNAVIDYRTNVVYLHKPQ